MHPDIDSAFAELGLTPAATEAEVKAAWRRLVSQWHPDRNDSAAALARMQRINRAVEAIREAGFERSPPGPASAGGEAETEPPRDDVDETPARTLHRRVKLTLEEAAAGCTRVLQGRITEACSVCAGAGYRVLGGHCATCQGSGAVRRRSWFGFIGAATECADCHGGGIARQACADCAGTGKAAAQRYRVTVRFPPGARDGDLLLVERRRHRPGALPGDLSIRVDVLPHPFLTLADDGTLHCELPVDGFAWMANRVVEVPTLDGLRTLPLQREQRCYRLPGLGFPVERRGARGDQVVTVLPVFPERMSTDQQILLDQLIATTSGADGRPVDERLQRWQQSLRAWQQRG